MSSEVVDKIARAVLYEGYLLYPYRPSALKNQQRWNFGVLYPPAWSARQTGSDRSYFQMECVASCSEIAAMDISVRFLQIVARQTTEGGWQEAIEQSISFHSLSVVELASGPYNENFGFPGGENTEEGVLWRKVSVEGQVEVSSARVHDNVFRLAVRVRNTSHSAAETRDEALMHSLASAHAVLQLRDAQFVSQVEPPEDLRDAIAACQNIGVWPVLVGDSGDRDMMLGAPIILYDYPQIANESKGDLFDGTEIDEILSLRILTLTDAEKEEVRRSDERARRILERLETSPPEHLLELHGAMRGVSGPQGDAWSAWDTIEGAPAKSADVSGIELKKGDRVRIRPRKRADIFDTLLEGKVAIIEAVEQDLENNVHFAVVLEDDPGRDLGEMRQIGHRFFFSTEEVELIEAVSSEST